MTNSKEIRELVNDFASYMSRDNSSCSKIRTFPSIVHCVMRGWKCGELYVLECEDHIARMLFLLQILEYSSMQDVQTRNIEGIAVPVIMMSNGKSNDWILKKLIGVRTGISPNRCHSNYATPYLQDSVKEFFGTSRSLPILLDDSIYSSCQDLISSMISEIQSIKSKTSITPLVIVDGIDRLDVTKCSDSLERLIEIAELMNIPIIAGVHALDPASFSQCPNVLKLKMSGTFEEDKNQYWDLENIKSFHGISQWQSFSMLDTCFYAE